MTVVHYVGSSDTRTVRVGNFVAVGILDQPTVTFNEFNVWQVDVSADAAAWLITMAEFSLIPSGRTSLSDIAPSERDIEDIAARVAAAMEGGTLFSKKADLVNGIIPNEQIPQIPAELGYAEIYSNVTVTALNSAPILIPGMSVSVECDGLTPLLVEAWVYSITQSAVTRQSNLYLYEDGNVIGQAVFYNNVAFQPSSPILLRRRYTPAAGAHTFSLKAAVGPSAGTMTFYAATWIPAHIRVVTVNAE
jgi:hypothetical protein